jgi:crotonobetainyl-CoA:carnitine CoA-transferase CaiB-like acyl-CoA transferase
MQPAAVDVPGALRELPFAPKYGEHTQAVLREAGVGGAELAALAQGGVVPPEDSAAEGARRAQA